MWRRRMEWVLANGPCTWCGDRQDLQVVYKDSARKTMKTTAIWSRRQEDRERILKDCMVLCRTCARSKRTEDRQPEHGTPGRYNQSCRCAPCRAAKAVEMAQYRARKKAKEKA
jgi:hypothetical protein